MNKVKNEIGNKYGPWRVVALLSERYPNNGCARFEIVCRHCGNTKFAIGNNLRFDHYAHTCGVCGRT